jgi:DNA helicase IV
MGKSVISFGCVKWFGGFNNKTGNENEYGFIEDFSNHDVYLHKNSWLGTEPPCEGDFVTYSKEKSGSKWKADDAALLVNASLGVVLELLVLVSELKGKPLSSMQARNYDLLVSLLSTLIESSNAQTLKDIFAQFDVGDSLFNTLENMSNWGFNEALLHEAGLLDSFLAKRQEEERRKEQEKLRLEILQEEKQNLAEVIRQGLETDYEKTIKNLSTIDKDGILDHDSLVTSWLQTFLKNSSGARLSEEQVRAIGDCSYSTLLRARAGSGKTTVIKHKIDFLIRHLGFKSSEIMALAFNTDAAIKIKTELQKDFGHVTFNNARTFHSLAYQIVRPAEDLLFDEGTGSNAKQSQLVQEIVRLEANPAFKKEMYEFFRREMKELEDTGSLLNNEDFYHLQRASTQDTLKGDSVKSVGEKWIADFLFEHGVSYMYERGWYLDSKGEKGRYHPDFSLAVWGNKTDVVIEHWGIDESDSRKSLPENWGKTWGEYRDEMLVKRQFWKEWNESNPEAQVLFLETSVRDLKNGREYFEDRLLTLLSESGVVLRKLPEDEIVEKVVRKHITRFSSLCVQLISRAKKNRLSVERLLNQIQDFKFSCDKERSFILLAFKIYKRYERELVNRNAIDFDDLLSRAVDKIRNQEGTLAIKNGVDSYVCLDAIKWLLVDEYQDFSQLFFDIVRALRERGVEFSLLCVGDDWQAINGFAGSDLRFFNNFQEYFNGARLLDLQNNYRSQPTVVEQGNRFMAHTGGQPSIAVVDRNPAPLNLLYVNKVFVEQRASFLKDDDPDERYKTLLERNGETIDLDRNGDMARLFKAVHLIMLSHDLGSTNFMMLSRGNRLGFQYENLSKFKRKLKSCFEPRDLKRFRNFDAQVSCTTAHRSKGAEADVVIVLNIVERRFPIIHPDNELFHIFGTSMEQVYAEEERLFYVAITRSKQSLYLLTETGRESEFLRRISTIEQLITHDNGLRMAKSNRFSF